MLRHREDPIEQECRECGEHFTRSRKSYYGPICPRCAREHKKKMEDNI